MVAFARFFLPFALRESCGKCTYCRIGTQRMVEIVDRLCEGHAKRDDIERLEDLAATMKQASFCGLGRTTPNPVLTSLRYFRDEYEAHLEGRCPAGQCKALITYSITDKCIGCTLCAQNCPAEAIQAKPYEQHEIDTEKCVRCGMCKLVCPEDAVKVE
jgi:formate hydrogenlyase subunit 6/NADH:ubiquinone oxidoreductase subunit I